MAVAITLLGTSLVAAEFIAQESDFQCLLDGQQLPGKNFFVFNRSKRKLRKALHVARLDRRRKHYPVGTILQLFPFEAMVKRGGRFNPDGDGWEFFRLSVTADSTQIVARGGAEVKNFAGSCQNCHAAARPYDFVCERHAVQSLPLPPDLITALQHDPRCPSAP